MRLCKDFDEHQMQLMNVDSSELEILLSDFLQKRVDSGRCKSNCSIDTPFDMFWKLQ